MVVSRLDLSDVPNVYTMAAVDLNRALEAATERRLQWNARDAIIYAHGIGLATDPLDETELAYVHNSEPLVFPTFPVSIALRGGAIGALGLDMRRLLHGEH